jgi:hypothetical protein
MEIPARHEFENKICVNCGIIAITTADDLKNVSSNLSGNYILLNDIDLGGEEWTPIGDSDNPFTGSFDGNGYKIFNFKITGAVKYASLTGLIGYNKGTIKNLGVEEIKAVGETFNPELHNAVMHIEDDAVTENTVVEEFQRVILTKTKS